MQILPCALSDLSFDDAQNCLKPNDANIVLSGGPTHDENMVYPIRSILDSGAVESHTYRIETISTTRLSENTASPVLGYDEAYEDTYGAADRLAYGDCFGDSGPAPGAAQPPPPATRPSRSLDARIDRALRETGKELKVTTTILFSDFCFEHFGALKCTPSLLPADVISTIGLDLLDLGLIRDLKWFENV
ncbi:hypothetical protein EVAR_46857_1 [Eumeta japonica]|uniref:Uncharacterized protein n=1 Tax=Eumeta variegata TaxID=151549 RepID=A0A4C1XPT3_EUMVA|nr:hypothetical protein EVAR_46857_1 [Eumeta japonica]